MTQQYIKEQLLSAYSKKTADKIAFEIGDNPTYFKELVKLITENDYRIVQRAAWPLSLVCKKNPALIKPYISFFIEKLTEPTHDALHRNVLRIFQDIPIPKEQQGILANICFAFLYATEKPIAIRVFAMSVLQNICKEEPELANELCQYIEGRIQLESPAFRSRGRKICAYWAKKNDKTSIT